MVLVKRIIPASGGQTENIDSSQLKEGEVYYINGEKKIYHAEQEIIPASGGQTRPKTESKPLEIQPFQEVQVGGEKYLLPELIVDVEPQGAFETKESYQRRLTLAEEQKKAFRQQQYLELQKEKIERTPETIVPASGGQTAQQFTDEAGNLLTKQEALQRIETSQTAIQDYRTYLQAEQKRKGISIYGSTAERYEKAGMPVMAGISRVLEVGEAGARSFVTGFGVGLLEDPLGSLANIGIAVGTLGIVPAYNLGVEISKSYGVTKPTPQLIIPKLSSTGFAEIPAVKGFTQSWRPKTGFDPSAEMGLLERGFRIGGEVGTSLLISYGVTKAVTKPIISKLRSIQRVDSMFRSYKAKKDQFFHVAQMKVKKLLGRDTEVISVGRTEVLRTFNLDLDDVTGIKYEARTGLIQTTPKGIAQPTRYLQEYGVQFKVSGGIKTLSYIDDVKSPMFTYSEMMKTPIYPEQVSISYQTPTSDILIRDFSAGMTYEGTGVTITPKTRNVFSLRAGKIVKDWVSPELKTYLEFKDLMRQMDMDVSISHPTLPKIDYAGVPKGGYGYLKESSKVIDDVFYSQPKTTSTPSTRIMMGDLEPVGHSSMMLLAQEQVAPFVSQAIASDIAMARGMVGLGVGGLALKGIDVIQAPMISPDLREFSGIKMRGLSVKRSREELMLAPAIDIDIIPRQGKMVMPMIKEKEYIEPKQALRTDLIKAHPISPMFTEFKEPVYPVFDLPEFEIGVRKVTGKKTKHKRQFKYIEDFESMIRGIGGGTGKLKIFTGFEPRRKVTKRVIKKKKKKVRKEKVKKKKKKGIIDKLFGGLI